MTACSTCPGCATPIGEVLAICDGMPVPGSLAVCSHCRVSLVFTAQLQLRLLTLEELVLLPPYIKETLSRATFALNVRKCFDLSDADFTRLLRVLNRSNGAPPPPPPARHLH